MPVSKPHYDFKKSSNIKKNRKYNKNFKAPSTESSSDSESDKGKNKDKHEHIDDKVTCEGNHIYFQTGVSDKTVATLIKIINQKNNEFKKLLENKMIESAVPKNLWLHITSYGGDLFACFRAIDAIVNSFIPIYTVVDGYAASAGTLMSVVGKKRYMTNSGYMLIHQLSAGACGNFWQIKDEYGNLEMHMEDIYNIYVKHSKLSKEELKSLLSHDIWFKIDKCIEYGLVDEVYV